MQEKEQHIYGREILYPRSSPTSQRLQYNHRRKMQLPISNFFLAKHHLSGVFLFVLGFILKVYITSFHPTAFPV